MFRFGGDFNTELNLTPCFLSKVEVFRVCGCVITYLCVAHTSAVVANYQSYALLTHSHKLTFE